MGCPSAGWSFLVVPLGAVQGLKNVSKIDLECALNFDSSWQPYWVDIGSILGPNLAPNLAPGDRKFKSCFALISMTLFEACVDPSWSRFGV